MIRLVGAITGSALALATLLVLVGIPQFKAEPNDIERAVVTLPVPTAAVEPEPEPRPVPDMTQAAEVPTEAAAPPPEAFAETIDDPPSEPLVAAVETLDFDSLPPFTMPAAEISEVIDAQLWYAFWSPFRSEIAASGFIAQLQRVTGLDYRVVRVKTGVYEVAFAYIEDDDIAGNLSQISAATGLDMPEG